MSSAAEGSTRGERKRDPGGACRAHGGPSQDNKLFAQINRLAVRLSCLVSRISVFNQGFDDLAIFWCDDSGEIEGLRKVGVQPRIVLQNAGCAVFPKFGNKIVATGRIGAND